MDQLGELALRLLGPEWEQKVGEAPIGPAWTGGTVGGVLRPPGSVGDVVFGRAVRNRVAYRVIFRQVVGIDVAGMQETEMRGVDVAFERLQIVAVALNAGD